MDNVAISFEKSLSLAQLQQQVSNQEMAIGKLTSLGRTKEVTIGVYEAADPPPKRLKLIALPEGQSPPSGTKLCAGKVWVTGQPQHLVAYRPD